MTMKISAILCLATVVALAGCEGDTGPAGPSGPQGPPGPSVILAYGTVNGAGAVTVSGPTGVTAVGARSSAGRYTVTVTGAFPTDEPSIIASVAGTGPGSLDRFALADVDCYAGTSAGTTCAANEIQFEVFIADAAGTAVDDQFSYVVLNE